MRRETEPMTAGLPLSPTITEPMRRKARLTVVRNVSPNEDALYVLQMLGLDPNLPESDQVPLGRVRSR